MLTIKSDYSLLPHNSFGIDVKAKEFVEYDSVDDLRQYLQLFTDNTVERFHIGGGNNLLFTGDYAGSILHSRIMGKEVVGEEGDEVLLKVGAGENWDEFVEWTLTKGYYGLENLSLIPSEVGASAVQNIGAYGSEAKDFIASVEVVDLQTAEVEIYDNAACEFAYRYSNFKGPWKGKYAITHVTFRLSKKYSPNLSYRALSQVASPDMDAMTLRNIIINVRESKLPDPRDIGNAGSFFMNPVVDEGIYKGLLSQYPEMPHYPASNGIKIPAGWLIEQCGWKGRSLGPAGVYEKQALVLVNLGGAKSNDIMNLSNRICVDVKDKFGIEIHPEVIWI